MVGARRGRADPLTVDCRLCGTRDLPLFYTQGDRGQYHFYRCPTCRLVNYDLRGGVNQEKYLLRELDPEARGGRNRGHRQTYAFLRRYAAPPGRVTMVPNGHSGTQAAARPIQSCQRSPLAMCEAHTPATNQPQLTPPSAGQ